MKNLTKVIAISVLSLSLFSCKKSDSEENQEGIAEQEQEYINKVREQLERPITPNPAIPKGPRHNDRLHVNHHGAYRDLFNDSNKYQYSFAEKFGIKPVESLRDAYFTGRPLEKITTNKYYEVDKLTHSMPFLVPEAAWLLKLIGRNFIDSLNSRGGDGYKIMVTSLLRTPATVKRLRRVNINASDSSCHKFATTFDISHSRFSCADSTRTIDGGSLKGILAEVLLDLRKQNLCMVKYERKSACFHITVTPQ